MAVVGLAVVGGGLGGYFGFRAATGGGGPGAAGGPAPRSDAAMAFDAATGTILMFGGSGADGVLGDTWSWDGSSWSRLHPATSPPARQGSLMAYDAAAHSVVLYGGTSFPRVATGAASGGSGYACPSSIGIVTPAGVVPRATSSGAPALPADTPPPGDTTSSPSQPSCSPPPPDPHAPRVFQDTWVWDGGNWHKAADGTPAQGSTQIGADPVSGSVVMVTSQPAVRPLILHPCPLPAQPSDIAVCPGPINQNGYSAFRWTGSTWEHVADPPAISAAASTATLTGSFALVQDPAAGRLSLFREQAPFSIPCAVPAPAPNGQPPPAPTGTRATAAPNTALPEPCLAQGAPATPETCCSGEVSQWTGTGWAAGPSFSGAPPLAPGNVIVAADPAHHDVLYYSGSGETWTWDGHGWQQMHPAHPPLLFGAASAFDAARSRVTVFGGLSQATAGATALYNATWTWDGADWRQLGGGAPLVLSTPTPTAVPGGTPCPFNSKPPVGDVLPICAHPPSPSP